MLKFFKLVFDLLRSVAIRCNGAIFWHGYLISLTADTTIFVPQFGHSMRLLITGSSLAQSVGTICSHGSINKSTTRQPRNSAICSNVDSPILPRRREKYDVLAIPRASHKLSTIKFLSRNRQLILYFISSFILFMMQRTKKTRTFYRNMGRRDYSRDWYCIFPLCPCSTYWNRYCGRSCFVGILQLYKCQIAGVIHLL